MSPATSVKKLTAPSAHTVRGSPREVEVCAFGVATDPLLAPGRIVRRTKPAMVSVPLFVPGHDVRLLRDGDETFPPMLEAIAGATDHIHVEVFILSDDVVGRRFSDALCERARAGVEVRLIYDGVGSLATPDAFFDRMRAAGVKTMQFHPVAPWRRHWGLSRRDHRKILVVDGRIGFAGGLNFDACHASPDQGGAGWRDTHARIEGPAVAELNRCFLDTWVARAAPEDVPRDLARYLVPPPAAGEMDVQVVANRMRPGRSPIRRAYLAALESARKRIWITNPYFLPDARLIQALTAAAKRGVDVRILVPARSDVRVVDLAARPIFRHLVHRGVRVYQWQASILHAKTAVVDDDWSTVGSFNLDPASFTNLELNLNVRHAGFAETVARTFREDLRRSAELVPTRVDRSPAHLRLAESMLHGLRHWL